MISDRAVPEGAPEHPEAAAEQAYIDFAYDCLEQMRVAAERLRDSALGVGGGGTHQGKFQRDVFVQTALERLEHLEIGRASLIFGRIDAEQGDTFYIGRRAVSGPSKEAVVVDWRAPAAAPFYRATARDPQGLVLRRHFAAQGRKLISIEDERFSSDPDKAETGLAGSGALMTALGAARTGYMRDIVATVQREQDEIIRAEMSGVLAVQGGPGTGKTAVALHRAAYLLFTYRKQIGSEGLLFIGPNRLFLRYISRVLPALGESGAILSTPEGLVPGVKVMIVDEPAVDRLKGDQRMSLVIKSALEGIEKPLPRDLKIKIDSTELKLTTSAMVSAIRSVQRTGRSHNAGRVQLERLLAAKLHRQLMRTAGKVRDRVSITKSDMGAWLAEEPAYVAALDEMWPVVTAEGFLQSLLSTPSRLKDATSAALDPASSKVLVDAARDRPEGYSRADLPLLDEIRVLIGSAFPHDPEAEVEEGLEDETRTYRHIVIDEAQDLSPMQLRMLARRSGNGSMTIVGDLAQATAHGSTGSWEEVFVHLPKLHAPRLMELTVNYRTPKEIMDLAVKLLAGSRPDLAPSESVRSTGVAPRFISSEGSIAEAVASAVTDLLHEVEGTVAIICDRRDHQSLAEDLTAQGVVYQDASEGMETRVTLATVDMVKGLEFDAVVVVEPDNVATGSPKGMSALYVSLTRATQALVVVHSPERVAALGH